MSASLDQERAPPVHDPLGSDALRHTLRVRSDRVTGFEAQTELATSPTSRPGSDKVGPGSVSRIGRRQVHGVRFPRSEQAGG